MTLHEDALAVLSAWSAPSVEAEATRRRFLEFVHPDPSTVWREHAGGHCEPGDTTLAGAALREATEESGIAGLRISEAPIGLDVHHVQCSGGASLHYDVRYAALAPAGAVEMVSAESRALGWFAPDALPEPLADATDNLVGPALAWAKRS